MILWRFQSAGNMRHPTTDVEKAKSSPCWLLHWIGLLCCLAGRIRDRDLRAQDPTASRRGQRQALAPEPRVPPSCRRRQRRGRRRVYSTVTEPRTRQPAPPRPGWVTPPRCYSRAAPLPWKPQTSATCQTHPSGRRLLLLPARLQTWRHQLGCHARARQWPVPPTPPHPPTPPPTHKPTHPLTHPPSLLATPLAQFRRPAPHHYNHHNITAQHPDNQQNTSSARARPTRIAPKHHIRHPDKMDRAAAAIAGLQSQTLPMLTQQAWLPKAVAAIGTDAQMQCSSS